VIFPLPGGGDTIVTHVGTHDLPTKRRLAASELRTVPSVAFLSKKRNKKTLLNEFHDFRIDIVEQVLPPITRVI
jgi:hypothetical protein